jgi:predicted phosphodiesterase
MRRLGNLLLVLNIAVFSLAVPTVRAQEFSGRTASAASVSDLRLPMREGSVKFLAIGDTGTGSGQQIELAKVMAKYRALFPYEFVLLMGDNIYGSEKSADMKRKFEDIYKPIIEQDVKFYASLGNHDESNQRFYELFNMKGEEYYRIQKGDVSFYALNSNYMDKRQLKWLEDELVRDEAKWRIAFMHHPPYSSGGKHGSSEGIREVLEPLFLKHGVDVVFAGHEHFYERIKPQKGIYYFITGAGGKLRKGDIKRNSPLTDKGFDDDLSFMLLEISNDEMHYQVISRANKTIDSGVIMRRD